MTPLEVWYQHITAQQLIKEAPDAEARKFRSAIAEKARRRVVEHLFPKITRSEGDRFRLVDQPPILYHVPEADFMDRVRQGLADYRQCLSDDRRVLLDRYQLADSALKVVGIGSVGTRCYIALMISDENTRCCCSSRKRADRFSSPTWARASMTTRASGLSWDSV
jgi:hypothetical protein